MDVKTELVCLKSLFVVVKIFLKVLKIKNRSDRQSGVYSRAWEPFSPALHHGMFLASLRLSPTKLVRRTKQKTYKKHLKHRVHREHGVKSES
jgi:hypothetical protein